ncbi:MAG TPA: sigma-54 dependent transcriptional regulator [Burkholderiaceae bacterium]|nr:sigma-54 dependent transcriptional regulator [Burkholderiaceae bacterium]
MSASRIAEAEASVRARVPAVLVVDDEADLRELLGLTITRLGLEVDTAESLEQAREFLRTRSYRLCLTDMRLPDGSGLDLVRELGARGEPKIAVITAYGSAENAVAAFKAGAFDYLAKPVDLDQLRLLIRSAIGDGAELGTGAATPTPSDDAALSRLVGESAEMVKLRALIERLGQSMAPVAIIGESGSGKELVARAIHAMSARRAMPFVAVNCGAIPESLMEAEFFGYRRGAFTGADRDRDGFFQAASGGTLLLDEVAELPLAMQVKLLRAIQERHIHKVGSTTEEAVDVRILSATHQDLARLVELGRFRQDLFYRLNVIELRVPSLRERGEDIALIAKFLLQRIAERAGAPAAWLTPEAEATLRQWSFPGNVRELENVLERAVVLTGGGEISSEDLVLETARAFEPAPPPSVATPTALEGQPTAPALQRAEAAPRFSLVDGVPSDLTAYLDEMEEAALRAALARTRHNRTAAAQLLGISFRQMRYRMQRLGLK